MSFSELLADTVWDTPFFKKLAYNDTGQSAGHQGGLVLPKDLRKFLPTLDEGSISPSAPTTDRYLWAEMFVGLRHLTDGFIRYQFQTWGGTRSPESRITEGIRPLRSLATSGDLILFQRRADVLEHFRLFLVKQDSVEFEEANQWVMGRSWGQLFPENAPVTQSQLTHSIIEIDNIAQQEFQIMRSEILRVETRQTRIARSSAFRERVQQEYDHQCAVSGIIITTPKMLYEVQSSHVVPVSKGGTDDIRNGFALTQTLHWAFDRGLFGILPNRQIYIPSQVKQIAENTFLRQFENQSINEARTQNLRVHPEAFAWHFDNLVRQWD